MIRPPPRSTLFPTRRSSDLYAQRGQDHVNRSPVLHKRHVLLGHDLRDNAFVAVPPGELVALGDLALGRDRKSTRLNSSHANISYAVFCLKKKLLTPRSSLQE